MSNPCNANASSYDGCILEDYIVQLSKTNSCLLPFYKMQINYDIEYCETFESGLESLESFQNLSVSCLSPCLLVIPDLTLQLEDNYLTNAVTRYIFYKRINSGEKTGLYLSLPKEITHIESKHEYSFISALEDFWEVAGLFLGISVYGCVYLLSHAFNWIVKQSGLQKFTWKYWRVFSKVAVVCVSFGFIIWILVVFISKYTSYPQGTHVQLESGIPNMSMAFCSSKNMFTANKTEFWEVGSNIRSKILYIEAMNSDGIWSSIWNISLPAADDENIFKTIVFPSNNNTLQFCHSYDLQTFSDLRKVTFTPNLTSYN